MRIICLLLLSLCSGLGALGQNAQITLNDKTVVKDSSGKVYSADEWQAMLSRGFTLKPEEPGNEKTAFYLIKPNPDRRAAMLEAAPKPRESQAFTTGKKINLFNARTLKGQKLDLKEARGKIIVLNFWFIDCRPCRMEISELNALVDSFKTNDQVLFVAVALDGKKDLEKFLEKTPFNYQVIYNGNSIAGMYGVRAYPTHVIIDQEEKVYFHTSGLAFNTIHWVRKSILELLEKHSEAAAE